MKVRGRNGKWLGTRDREVVRVVWIFIVFQLSSRVCQRGGRNNALIVINVIEG